MKNSRANANKKIKKPVRRPHPITVMLWDAGSSVGEVALTAGVSSTHITQVCSGKGTNARVVGMIEKILGKPWHLIQAEARAKLRLTESSAA